MNITHVSAYNEALRRLREAMDAATGVCHVQIWCKSGRHRSVAVLVIIRDMLTALGAEVQERHYAEWWWRLAQ